MKGLKPMFFVLVFAATVISVGCAENDHDENEEDGDCYVHLYDGDNFTDDNIRVTGPGEFPNLNNLPGADKDWDDEADSFKSGKNTTVIFYTEPNFAGDSTVYKNGAQKSSINEPRSMKIICN